MGDRIKYSDLDIKIPVETLDDIVSNFIKIEKQDVLSNQTAIFLWPYPEFMKNNLPLGTPAQYVSLMRKYPCPFDYGNWRNITNANSFSDLGCPGALIEMLYDPQFHPRWKRINRRYISLYAGQMASNSTFGKWHRKKHMKKLTDAEIKSHMPRDWGVRVESSRWSKNWIRAPHMSVEDFRKCLEYGADLTENLIKAGAPKNPYHDFTSWKAPPSEVFENLKQFYPGK